MTTSSGAWNALLHRLANATGAPTSSRPAITSVGQPIEARRSSQSTSRTAGHAAA
jgi:hypothetical protein